MYTKSQPKRTLSESNTSFLERFNHLISYGRSRWLRHKRLGRNHRTQRSVYCHITPLLRIQAMQVEIARMCDIVQTFPGINAALELYFLLNSDRKLWVLDKPVLMPVQVILKDNRRQTRRSRTYSLKVLQVDGTSIFLTEPKEGIHDAVVFSASVIDLQNLIRRIAKKGEFISAEVVKEVEVGGQLDLRINGTTLSRQQVLQIIEERVVMADGLDSQVGISISPVDLIITDKVTIVLDQEANSKKLTSYSSDGHRISKEQETLTSSIDAYINRVFAKHANVQEVVVADSVTRTIILSKKRNHRSHSPPACNLGGDKMEFLTSQMKTREYKPSCSTMTRCLCKLHHSFPCTVMMFYESILKARGDVAMERGDCPMCCVKPDTRSKKPLVRLTEEVDWTLKTGHDWSDFQFRGMLFEMFPNAWVAVENAVYRDKDLVVSTRATNALNSAIKLDLGVEDVLRSNELRPWPMYEMAISRSHGQKAHHVAMRYLDLAFGHVFLKQYKGRLEDDNPNVIRIFISAAQLIPAGDCLLDDTQACEPLSRSESHTVGCLVSYTNSRARVLAELLRTWASVEWNGDVASYLTCLFREEFSKGALGFYFNSDRTKGVKVEMVGDSLHVTHITCYDTEDGCELRNEREDNRALKSLGIG